MKHAMNRKIKKSGATVKHMGRIPQPTWRWLELGQRVRTLRKARGWLQDAMASAAGIGRVTLVRALGVDFADLFADS